MLASMFTVSDAEAAAIRAAFERGGELSAAVELRRRFPGIFSTAQARECARIIARWKGGRSREHGAWPEQSREALEESGCSVKVGRLTGLYFGVDTATLLLVFRATSSTVDPHPDPNDEDAVDAGWFPAATALQMVTHVGEHQRLADALADRPEVAYRTFGRSADPAST